MSVRSSGEVSRNVVEVGPLGVDSTSGLRVTMRDRSGQSFVSAVCTCGILPSLDPKNGNAGRRTMFSGSESGGVTVTTSVPAAPSRRLSLGSMLWTSTRMWQEQIDDHWVLFAPDRRGLPVVVSQRVMAILDLCRAGATVDSIVKSACTFRAPLDPAQALAVADF